MKALVLLGCPEAPSQTPIGLYASYKLGQMGYDVTVSSNPAAGKILDISDPEGVYVKKRVDIEKCLSAGVVPAVLEGRVTIDVISEKESLKIIEETNSENKGIGIFVRNIEENYVVCPMGQILRKKSVNGGKIRYANKAACKKCPKDFFDKLKKL